MTSMAQAASDFLAHRRIAVTGVSRSPGSHGGNVVYRRLRERGYEVFPVNPNAAEVEGDPCYADLASVPGPIEGVVICSPAESAEETVRQCHALGITDVWMHRALGPGSLSLSALDWGNDHGLNVIGGGCPLMFEPCADQGHKAMRFIFSLTGRVPRTIESPRMNDEDEHRGVSRRGRGGQPSTQGKGGGS